MVDDIEEARAEANNIYTELQVYTWDDEHGYMPDDKETKIKCHYMIDRIITEIDFINGIYGGNLKATKHWKEIKKQINKL